MAEAEERYQETLAFLRKACTSEGRYAAEQGYNLLLGQGGGPETVAEGVSIYRRAVEAQGRTYDSSMVGLTRALHIAMNDTEREAARELRAKFMSQVQQLSLSPTGESPILGRPRKPMSRAEMDAVTERDALIGPPEEIVARLKRLQQAGVEYVMVIDFAGSLEHLRIFAREVMPEFAEP